LKIGFFEIEPWEKDVFSKAFPKDKLFFSTGKITVQNAPKYKDLEAISIFVYSKTDQAVLNQLPKLRLITTRSTGFDHINLEACKKKNITVCNVPTYGENTVAEHTFALILALSRKILDCVERTKQGSFDLTGLRGFDLKGKTIGVVGGGNIGKHVIRMAQGFEMKVLVFDLFQDKKLAQQLGFNYAPLDTLLKQADIVTLHLPYNKHTHHLMDKTKLALLKPSVLLINTSRGGIVDTDALVYALQRKKIAGAGLDVLENECDLIEERVLLTKEFNQKCDLKTLAENHLLLNLPKVIITPHNAFNTTEALMRILETDIQNIKNFQKNKAINLVK